ncbi:MAG: deoxyribonuclease IV [Malacoplasma sp.]
MKHEKILLGPHVSFKSKEYLLGSVQEALLYNANCFMIFTGPPQNTIRGPINKEQVELAHKLMKEHNIDLNNIVVHAPYIMNLCNPLLEKRKFAIDILVQEINRTFELGFKLLVLHPGNFINLPIDEAIAFIAKGINIAIKKTSNTNVLILVETMSGKGTEIGSKLDELKNIIDLIEDKTRIGVCIDTCHMHEAGYDILDCKKTLKLFDEIIGLDYLKVIHLNDSKNVSGARKDRHENIGYGHIGFNSLCEWAHTPILKSVPKILETPFFNNVPIYKEEIEMINNKEWLDVKNE